MRGYVLLPAIKRAYASAADVSRSVPLNAFFCAWKRPPPSGSRRILTRIGVAPEITVDLSHRSLTLALPLPVRLALPLAWLPGLDAGGTLPKDELFGDIKAGILS